MAKRKPQRRQARGLRPHATLRNGLRVRMFEGPRLGGGVVSATPDEVLVALDRLDPDLPWKKVRDQFVPVLPRVRPLPGPDFDLVRTVLPPGILVSFAIDIGPALTHIGSDLLDSWPIDRTTLVATGLANLRGWPTAAARSGCSTTTSATSRSVSSSRASESRPPPC
ncbi:MAG TPA: hypothetical protein VFO78_00615 [Candidatus Limnocylindrales bacterium]|nr:hypothetical protein [Candidatus Limnocylindrales bacterium]